MACAQSAQTGVALTGIRALVGVLQAEMITVATVTRVR